MRQHKMGHLRALLMSYILLSSCLHEIYAVREETLEFASAIERLMDKNNEDVLENVETKQNETLDMIYQQSSVLRAIEEEVDAMSKGSLIKCDGVLVEGYCYILHNQQYNRASAVMSCRETNMSLAVISNQEQYVAVNQYIKQSVLMANTPLLMAWTAMDINGTETTVRSRSNWTPGYPRGDHPYIMLRIISSTFLLFGDENGYINAPDQVIGYPLCYYRPVKETPTAVTTTTGPVTTVPVTTGPVTTVPVTTGPVTTVPIKTVPITTVPITTVPITTVPVLDPKSCDEVKAAYPNQSDGVFSLDLFGDGQKTEVYCDLSTDGGRWLVFQRRYNGEQSFYNRWNSYVNGFGDANAEFWLGLETLYKLTSNASYEMRVDLERWNGDTGYAHYSNFSIGEGSDYTLNIGGYSGTAGDSLTIDDGGKFSTYDRDQDEWSFNCAEYNRGAWWHRSCSLSNINGHYFGHPEVAIDSNWWYDSWESLKSSKMMIRKTA